MQNKGISAEKLASPGVKHFLKEHLKSNLVALALQMANKSPDFPLAPVLELLDVYQRGGKKLPGLIEAGWLFTKRSYEQASSETAAAYKAQLLTGNSLLNLSGGIGVDDYFFAQYFDEVVSVDLDEQVHELAKFNLRKEKPVSRICLDAEEYLKDCKSFDVIYIDPDRRTGSQRKVGLQDCSPDVVALWPTLLNKADKVLLKASPLLDIDQALKDLDQVVAIHAVAIQGEVKELLFLAQKGFDGDPELTAIDLVSRQQFRGSFRGNSHATRIPYEGEVYFFETHAAINKLGLAESYGNEQGTYAINQSGTYRVSNQLPDDFMGRRFRLVQQSAFHRKTFKKYLTEHGIVKANLNKRDFPLSVAEIRKQFKLADGGEDYFFFYRDEKQQTAVVHARKLHPEE